jgi:hypothetical protein
MMDDDQSMMSLIDWQLCQDFFFHFVKGASIQARRIPAKGCAGVKT